MHSGQNMASFGNKSDKHTPCSRCVLVFIAVLQRSWICYFSLFIHSANIFHITNGSWILNPHKQRMENKF